MPTRGQCLCKKTSWEFSGKVTWGCYCHCDDCRRNCSAPVAAWLGIPLKNFRWTGLVPRTHESSRGVYRHFCGICGTPMAFEAEHYEGAIHLYAASLENPEKFTPEFHVNYQSKLPWLQISDDLPKYDGTVLHAAREMATSNSKT